MPYYPQNQGKSCGIHQAGICGTACPTVLCILISCNSLLLQALTVCRTECKLNGIVVGSTLHLVLKSFFSLTSGLANSFRKAISAVTWRNFWSWWQETLQSPVSHTQTHACSSLPLSSPPISRCGNKWSKRLSSNFGDFHVLT